MKNIADKSNYCLCKMKKYKAQICMPPRGTCVINKFEQPELVAMARREYLTVKEMMWLYVNNIALYTCLCNYAQIVDYKSAYVVVGTRGEFSVIDFENLTSQFAFYPGVDITYEGVIKRSIDFNGNQLSQYLPANGWYLPWSLVESKNPENDFRMTCFVPSWDKTSIELNSRVVVNINHDSVQHGMGDFVVCPISDKNTADIRFMRVVNGLVFTDTFECEQQSHNMVESYTRYNGPLPSVI